MASYAWGRDYHNHIGKRLQRLTRDLRAAIPGLETYAGVDSRPLIERAWAQASGLGFIGKNAMAILPGKSSYFFLAAILVNIDLEPDSPIGEHCGSCQRCLVGCPTQAFTAPGELDARRCISYLTIEFKGIIPDTLKRRWGDGCLAATFAKMSAHTIRVNPTRHTMTSLRGSTMRGSTSPDS